MSKIKKTQFDSFAKVYLNIADGVLAGGWIEVGSTEDTRSFVRALDAGIKTWLAKPGESKAVSCLMMQELSNTQ